MMVYRQFGYPYQGGFPVYGEGYGNPYGFPFGGTPWFGGQWGFGGYPFTHNHGWHHGHHGFYGGHPGHHGHHGGYHGSGGHHRPDDFDGYEEEGYPWYDVEPYDLG